MLQHCWRQLQQALVAEHWATHCASGAHQQLLSQAACSSGRRVSSALPVDEREMSMAIYDTSPVSKHSSAVVGHCWSCGH